MTYYEVFDLGTANLVASVEHEEEALAFVRELLSTGYAGYVTDLALARTDEHGEKHAISEGIELTARALAKTLITPAA